MVLAVLVASVGLVALDRDQADRPRPTSSRRTGPAVTPSMRRARAAAKRTGQPVLAANATVVVGAFNRAHLRDNRPSILPREGPCFASGMGSSPPACGGVAITNWVWPGTVGVDHNQGVRWGDYRLVGTFDDEHQAFTLTEMPVPARQVPTSERPRRGRRYFRPSCPEPPGGWFDPKATRNGTLSAGRLKSLARQAPDFVDLSVSQRRGPDAWTVAFTGDLERHRAELRQVWGGGLCVVRKPVDANTLDAWRQRMEVELEAGHLAGDHVLEMGADPDDGTIHVGVWWAPPGTAERLSARYRIPITVDRVLKPAA